MYLFLDCFWNSDDGCLEAAVLQHFQRKPEKRQITHRQQALGPTSGQISHPGQVISCKSKSSPKAKRLKDLKT